MDKPRLFSFALGAPLALGLVLFALGETQAFAQTLESCPEAKSKKSVDMRNEFPPIRNQGKTGYCYAFSAVDVKTHRLFKDGYIRNLNDPSQLPSPGAIGMQYGASERLEVLAQNQAEINAAKALQPVIAEKKAEVETSTKKLEGLTQELAASDPKLKPLHEELRETQKALDEALKNAQAGPYQKEVFASIKELNSEAKDLKRKIKSRLMKNENYRRLSAQNLKLSLELEKLEEIATISHTEEPGGGWVDSVLNSNSIKWCSEESVSSSDQFLQEALLALNPNLTDANFPYHSDQPKNQKPNLGEKLSLTLGAIHLAKSRPEFCALGRELKSLFPGLSVEEIADVIQDYQKEDPIVGLINKACKPLAIDDEFFNKYDVIENTNKDRNLLFEDLDRVLESGNSVSLSFDARILSHSKSQRKGKAGWHAVTVVGKNYNCETKSDEYIVRNSWGPDSCESGRPFYQSLDKKSPELIENNLTFQNCNSQYLPKTDFRGAFGLHGAQPLPTSPNMGGIIDTPNVDPEELKRRMDGLTQCYAEYTNRNIALNKPPFRCTKDGYYIINAAALKETARDITYYEQSKDN